MRIERPDAHHGPPEDDEFETIGQFYEAIENGLKHLCDERERRRSSAVTRPAR
jgi:Ferritin-like